MANGCNPTKVSRAPSAAMVQGAIDTCYRMGVDAFRREIDRRGAFHELMSHYAQALFGVVAQSTACNTIHSVEQRLARWLLMAHDRSISDEVPITHEALARSLGTRRASVSVTASALQKKGAIRYNRGVIRILDRKYLESASCECYETISAHSSM